VIEDEIKDLIQNEVGRQMDTFFDRVEHAITVLDKIDRDVEGVRSQLNRNRQDIHSVNDALRDITGVEPVAPPVRGPSFRERYPPVRSDVPVRPAPRTAPVTRPAPVVRRPAPQPEPEPEPVEEGQPLEWVQTQKGDLDKGETQIWEYGSHVLTVWNEGKKMFCQVDDGAAEELWKQAQLEKIQKRIEKMEQ
jgi:hypothetical protein